MEMLEHVPDPAKMIGDARAAGPPGGSVFISTINRNLKSFLLAIVGAEYVMRLIPRGTHEYERLIRPAELGRWARAAGWSCAISRGSISTVHGAMPLSRDPSVNYLVHLQRAGSSS